MKEGLIADSTFYICFLDCIQKPEVLIKIIKNFKANIPQRVFQEICKSKNSHHLLQHKDCLNIFDKPHLNLGEVLRPFVSENELKKGEHEIIVLAYVCSHMGIKFILILDEASKRNLVKNIIPELIDNMTGTLGFLKMCCCKYHIFNNTEIINLIDEIEKSSFRIDKRIIMQIKKEIKENE